MSENTPNEKQPESTTARSGTSIVEIDNQRPTLGVSQAVSLCATGLLIAFFLPWGQFLGGQFSGFDLQKLSDEDKFLWLVPVFCLITIVGGITGRSQKVLAQFTGTLPFFALGIWYYRLGSDVLKIMSYGAYLSLILGAALFILPRQMK